MEKLEGCLSPKASQEKRSSLPGDSKAEGREQDRKGRQGCRWRAPWHQVGLPVHWNVFLPGAAAQMPALNNRTASHAASFFFPPIVSPKRQWLSTNSPDSLITRPPDSTSDWFSYFQRKYDFQVSLQFRYKSLNFNLTLVNTPE